MMQCHEHGLGVIVEWDGFVYTECPLCEPEQSEPVEQQPDAVKEWNEIDVESCNLYCNIGFVIAKGNSMRDALLSRIAALEAENARLRQVPEESEALVKARVAYRKDPRCLSEVNNREYVLMSYIRELEAWKKQVEERT